MKKQFPLRISQELANEIQKMADESFRSLNSEIEYLLAEGVKRHKRGAQLEPLSLEDQINLLYYTIQNSQSNNDKQ